MHHQQKKEKKVRPFNSIAVAKVNNDLHAFLDWYNKFAVEPNITSLAMTGLPPGRGRKGGIPRRKRHSA